MIQETPHKLHLNNNSNLICDSRKKCLSSFGGWGVGGQAFPDKGTIAKQGVFNRVPNPRK